MRSQIVTENWAGYHNTSTETEDRLIQSGAYEDLSTICIVPAFETIPSKVVQSWMAMMTPMNAKFTRIFVLKLEVGEAYNQAIKMILEHPDLSKWKYVLTLEHDNAPPPDGLLKLYESIRGKVDGNKYDGVGSIYWTKGPGGMAMGYGDPQEFPKNFRPLIPKPETVMPCNGIAMGFSLFRLDMFKDEQFKKDGYWFKTVQEIGQNGMRSYTQDLEFCERAGKYGYKFALDTRVKTGHYDLAEDIMW